MASHMSDVAIGDHGFPSDCHSPALVTRTGSVDGLCSPHFHSPSAFGPLLDDEAGHWSITAANTDAVTRPYLSDTLVLQTRFTTPSGVLVLTDALALGEDNRGHDIGAGAPHALLRTAACARAAWTSRPSTSRGPSTGSAGPSSNAMAPPWSPGAALTA